MPVRPLTASDDVRPVLALAARIEATTGVPPFGESKFVDLQGPRRGSGFVFEDEEVAAYVHVLHHDASGVWEMELAALDAVPDAAIGELVARAVGVADGPVLWWTFGDSPAAAFALAHFQTVRELHKLTGALPVPAADLPSGLTVRPFRVGRDEEAWLRANNAAFAGHAENGGWSRTDLEDRMRRPWFDPAGFRLAWVGEELAGFCWTKLHPGAVGEIYVIAVDPDFQGRGIGRAIVEEGLRYLAEVGCETGMLYVDAANRSALALYQSLGFTAERIDRCAGVPKGWPHEAQ